MRVEPGLAERLSGTGIEYTGAVENTGLSTLLSWIVPVLALLATRRKAEAVTMDDFTRAIERIVAGLAKKNRLLRFVGVLRRST